MTKDQIRHNCKLAMKDHRRRIHQRENRLNRLPCVLDDARTDSRNHLSNRVGQAMRGIAKREEDVCSEGMFDFDAELRPMWSLENRRKFLQELLYK